MKENNQKQADNNYDMDKQILYKVGINNNQTQTNETKNQKKKRKKREKQ